MKTLNMTQIEQVAGGTQTVQEIHNEFNEAALVVNCFYTEALMVTAMVAAACPVLTPALVTPIAVSSLLVGTLSASVLTDKYTDYSLSKQFMSAFRAA